MTVFDYAVLLIVGLSVLLGLWRGAIKEILSLVGWVAAFFVASAFGAQVAKALASVIESPTARVLIAYVSLFVATLALVWLLQILLSSLFKAIGLGGLDRMLGVAIGLARGVLIVLVAVLIGGMTTLPRDPFWRDALSAKWFETMAIYIKPWLPEEFAGRINFDRPTKA